MTTLARLGADDLRLVVAAFRDALQAHKDGINRLNVYPVPDGDTGSNMALTITSVAAELEGVDGDLAAVCKAIGHGALMGARGNSGVILSQILRGLTQTLATAADGEIDGVLLAQGLEVAAKGAYEAVGNPVEGTILTVIRVASEGASAAAGSGGSLVEVLDAARTSGHEALANTPEQLEVLKAAGVVDAGGTGLMLLIDGFLHVVDDRELPAASVTEAVADAGHVEELQILAHGDEGHERGLADLRYEVMYILEAPDEAISAFKDVWAGIGDSIVVVGGDGLFNCHIHTDDIGPAIEAAIEIGKPSKIRVTDLLEEVEEERWVREAEEHPEPEPDATPVTTAVVAIATGDGIKRIFHSLGARVLTGGQSMNPSTAQILEAVEAAPADHVVILPNNKNIIAVAQQVDATTDKTVVVVPTKGIPEGFAALLAYDPDAEIDDNASGMAEAAANVLAGEVTQAVRDSSCDVGPIVEGDYLGIARDGIRAVAPTVSDATIGLLDHLLTEDHEIVTLITGEGSTDGETRKVMLWLEEHHEGVEAETHHGGQPLYPYFLGIE
ncbi:MAG TPA: DAK2 domain-containing protein [Acidimicrobiales bacterium]|jgi:DAK2 domain fusion protein YloV|nr:DAK2 domain-containing protein [Acidimicrobiales bacterium]